MPYQRDVEKKVRIGLVGVGDHAYRNILPTLTFLPVELVAIVDINADLASRTANQYGLATSYTSTAEMYANEELDAVLLCVSPRLHPRLAIEAFRAGLHVWMEKPVSSTLAELDEMIAARGDRIAVAGFKKVFMPATMKAVELLERETLQPVRSATAIYPIAIPHGDRASLDRGDGGLWLSSGCHPVAMLLTLCGRPESVTVHRGTDDAGFVIIKHAGGAVSSLHLAYGAPDFQPIERYTVFGGSQSISIENTRKVTWERGITFEYSTGTSFAPPGTDSGSVSWEAQDGMNTLENKAVFTQGMFGELNYFAECVLTKSTPTLSTLEFARDVVAVYEAGILSEGNEILLSSVGL